MAKSKRKATKSKAPKTGAKRAARSRSNAAAAAADAVEPTDRLSPPKASWLVVDRMQLMEILGQSDGTISDWLKHGMPALERGGHGKPGKYDAIACLQWYRENKVGRNALEIAKTESAREDVVLKRFKSGELARELVRTREVVAMGAHFVKGWVALIRALPRQARRTGLIETAEQEQALDDLCRRALEEVSRWDVPAVPMQTETEADAATDSADDSAA